MSSVSDPIGDFLTRIRNASRSGKTSVVVPVSKRLIELARILKQEGFISDYSIDASVKFGSLNVFLKYNSGRPVITDLRRVSRPGLRRYVGVSEVPRVLSGLGVSILSTSSGMMSSREARRKNVGGELLAFVW
jgi:small subunit ribosomal protein S8